MRLIKLYIVPAAVTGALILLFILDFSHTPCSAEYKENTRCADIEKRYDSVLSAATGACRADADCGCYHSVSKKSKCGGITDKKSAARLQDLSRKFIDADCESHWECAPWVCNPVCNHGRCRNGPRMRR